MNCLKKRTMKKWSLDKVTDVLDNLKVSDILWFYTVHNPQNRITGYGKWRAYEEA